MKSSLIFNRKIKIADKMVSADSPVFIIAEAGVNHNGDIALAKELVDVAAKAGADAVKFQAFRTEELILSGVEKAPYQKKTTQRNESQFDMLKKLELSRSANLELKRYCAKKKIIFLTTPFDEGSLGDLDQFDIPAYKVASTDLTNLLFIKKVAGRKKPIILSTGMSYMNEVEVALIEINKINKDVILLQCSANYPVQDNEVNLRVMRTYQDRFNVLVGYSDHTCGVGASPFAVAAGAKVIEKHFTLDKKMKGPDHAASLSPKELKEFVLLIRKVETYLGSDVKEPTRSEKLTRKTLQKNLVAARDIIKGHKISEKDIVAKRTGGKGISPVRYRDIIGMQARKNYVKDDIL